MKITKIVITGGPCAGKTTGLSYLEQELTQMGYKVVFMNESATEIILNGFGPKAFTNNLDFEKNIIRLQLEKEKLYEEFCKTLPNENVVLVCDRGVMDCKCYMTQQEFDQALIDLDLDEIQLRDSYDAVFHLVSAAKGDGKAYSLASNNARTESAELAARIDDRLLEVWKAHPRRRIIDTGIDFNKKLDDLITKIKVYLETSQY